MAISPISSFLVSVSISTGCVKFPPAITVREFVTAFKAFVDLLAQIIITRIANTRIITEKITELITELVIIELISSHGRPVNIIPIIDPSAFLIGV